MAPFNAVLRAIGTAGEQRLSIYISDLPKSVLETIPSLPAPAGAVSNFQNRASRRGSVIMVSTILMVLVLICMGIRVWTKFMIVRPIRLLWSDFTIAISFVACVATYILTILTVTPGGTTGFHLYDVPLSETFTNRNIIPLFMVGILSAFALGIVKLTLFITYVEIFFTEHWVKIACTIGAMISTSYYGLHVILRLAWGIPRNGTPWRHQIFADSSFRTQELSLPRATVGVVVDIYLIIIPLIAVSKLHLTPKKKAGVMLIFATGFLAIIGSILNLIYRLKLHDDDDVTWDSARVTLVNIIEVYLGMCIACTVDISKFIHIYKGKFKKAGCALISCSCCRNLRKSKGGEKDWEKQGENSSGDDKSIQSLEKEKKKKPVKLYPGLDISETPRRGSDNLEPVSPVSPTTRNEMFRRRQSSVDTGALGLWGV